MSIAEHVTGLQHLGFPPPRWTRPPLFMSPLALSGPTALSIPARGSGYAFSPAAACASKPTSAPRPPAGPEPSTTWPWTWTTLSPPGRKCGRPAWLRWKMPFSSSPSGRTACAFSTYWAPTERRWSSARGCRPRSVWLRLVSSVISDSFLCAKLENLPDPLAKGPLYRL